MRDEQSDLVDQPERLYGMPAQRTPVEYDADSGGLRIGAHERRVENPAEPGQVYSAYLSLLYAVRGAQPGKQLSLRSADLEALLLIVGDDPDTIEQRLIGLMGCTADEARALRRILLRHRKLTVTLGIAAALGAGSVATGLGTSDGGPVRTELVQSVAASSDAPQDAAAPTSDTSGRGTGSTSTVLDYTAPASASVVVSGAAPDREAGTPASSASSGSDDGGADAAPATSVVPPPQTAAREVTAPAADVEPPAAPGPQDGSPAESVVPAPKPAPAPAPAPAPVVNRPSGPEPVDAWAPDRQQAPPEPAPGAPVADERPGRAGVVDELPVESALTPETGQDDEETRTPGSGIGELVGGEVVVPPAAGGSTDQPSVGEVDESDASRGERGRSEEHRQDAGKGAADGRDAHDNRDNEMVPNPRHTP